MAASVYVETTVPSYFVSNLSRDLIVAAHQAITREWWETRLPRFRAYVSPVVLAEIRLGDAQQSARRLDAVADVPVLEAKPQVEELAAHYMTHLGLPGRAIRDAAHLAFACFYNVDYMVTWNCAHIANAEVIRRLHAVNATRSLTTPIICTPEELMGVEEK